MYRIILLSSLFLSFLLASPSTCFSQNTKLGKAAQQNDVGVQQGPTRSTAQFGTALSVQDLNDDSEVAVAAQTSQTVTASVVNPYQVKLTYHGSDGTEQWTRAVDFPAETYDLRESRLQVEIADDGSRVALYTSAYESTTVAAVYAADGRLVTTEKPFAFLAPSGNYFYGYGYFYSGSKFVFYDADFEPVDLGLESVFGMNPDQYEYALQYRMYAGDILVARVAEYPKPERVDPKTLERDKRGRLIRPERERGPRPLLNSTLYVYDLTTQEILATKNLKAADYAERGRDNKYDIRMTEGNIDARRNGFAAVVLSPTFEKRLLTRSEGASSVREEETEATSVALSEDGQHALISIPERAGRKFEVRSMNTGDVVHSISTSDHNPVKRFSLVGDQIRVLRQNGPNVPELTVYSQSGSKVHAPVRGWFNANLSRGVGPTPSSTGKGVSLRRIQINR